MADIQVGTIKDIAKSKVDFDAEQLSSYLLISAQIIDWIQFSPSTYINKS